MARKRKQLVETTATEETTVDLARKYRPSTLDEFYGNSVLKNTLKSLITRNKIPQQILFFGPKGCGKTTLSRLCARYLNCSEFDLKEIDVADFRGIDSVREIRRTMGTKPMKGAVKVYILDEVALLGRGGDSAKNEAQSCLLKALEEPPKHVYFFLCTTDPQNLISTLKSRCVQYQVSTLSPKQIVDLLNHVCEQERVELPKKVSVQIARDSLGHPRDALKILEKIIHLNEDDMLEAAQQEAEKREQTITLCRALMEKKSWKQIADILKNIDEDPEAVRRKIRGYFASVLLNDNAVGFIVLDTFKQAFYNTDGRNELIRGCYEAWSELNE